MSTTTHQRVHDELAKALGDHLEAIQAGRQRAAELTAMHNPLASALSDLQRHLEATAALDHDRDGAVKRHRLIARIERVHELVNMAEIGSLGIEINRHLEAVWRRSP